MRMPSVLAFLACLALAEAAHAQPGDPVDAPPAAPQPLVAPAPAFAPPGMVAPRPQDEVRIETEHYGWQIVVSDVLAIGLAVTNDGTAVPLGGLTYLLGGPIIHGMHGEGGRAAGSLALRVGLPVLGALAGRKLLRPGSGCAQDDEGCGESPEIGGLIVGGAIGLATAMIVDAALVARPRTIEKRVTWTPQITATSQHVGVAVLGRF
ncbi:MAG TPA: hypothetical protein VFK02_03800 [Kofleriaceae bacterium]|nr:hypothetical protein [Kofleriaceae bacterium]